MQKKRTEIFFLLINPGDELEYHLLLFQLPTFIFPHNLFKSLFLHLLSFYSQLSGVKDEGALLCVCACVRGCVCSQNTRLQDRSLYHVCTMTHFFHWDGIYVTYQTQVSRRDRASLRKGGRRRWRRRQKEICDFNYASIIFTVQKHFFGKI